MGLRWIVPPPEDIVRCTKFSEQITDALAADSQLTPQVLADMSEEQFAAIFNELQERGDKTRLKQLLGH
jgi:hypothetical protein